MDVQGQAGLGPVTRDHGGFLFLGGDLSIDLVNTQMMVGGELVDRLADPVALAAWVIESDLGARLDEQAATELCIPGAVFDRVVALRAHLRVGFDQLAADGRVPSSAVRAINELLVHGPGTQLRVGPLGQLERVSHVDLVEQPTWLPWLLADAAANLLASPAVGLLRRCAGQVCVLYFVDTSRNHSRRWCSMELCGNRSKVSSHHQRTRGTARRGSTTGQS